MRDIHEINKVELSEAESGGSVRINAISWSRTRIVGAKASHFANKRRVSSSSPGSFLYHDNDRVPAWHPSFSRPEGKERNTGREIDGRPCLPFALGSPPPRSLALRRPPLLSPSHPSRPRFSPFSSSAIYEHLEVCPPSWKPGWRHGLARIFRTPCGCRIANWYLRYLRVSAFYFRYYTYCFRLTII